MTDTEVKALAPMTDLIARIESADGPSYALDREIGEAMGRAFAPPQPYSASIDAALTLVPGDAFWRIGHDGEGADPSLFKAQVLMPMVGQCVSIASTPALALAAAALKARGV